MSCLLIKNLFWENRSAIPEGDCWVTLTVLWVVQAGTVCMEILVIHCGWWLENVCYLPKQWHCFLNALLFRERCAGSHGPESVLIPVGLFQQKYRFPVMVNIFRISQWDFILLGNSFCLYLCSPLKVGCDYCSPAVLMVELPSWLMDSRIWPKQPHFSCATVPRCPCASHNTGPVLGQLKRFQKALYLPGSS